MPTFNTQSPNGLGAISFQDEASASCVLNVQSLDSILFLSDSFSLCSFSFSFQNSSFSIVHAWRFFSEFVQGFKIGKFKFRGHHCNTEIASRKKNRSDEKKLNLAGKSEFSGVFVLPHKERW